MSNTEIDIDRVLALTFVELGKTLSLNLKRGSKKLISTLFLDEKTKLSSLVKNNYKRLSKTQTLIYSDPEPLDSMFVMPHLHSDDGSVEVPDVSSIDSYSNRIIFFATAGAGKSSLLKYTFLEIVRKRRNLVPIFIEFRKLNGREDKFGIADLISEQMGEEGLTLEKKEIMTLLGSGRVALLLDGYDELELSKRPHINRELKLISNNINSGIIIITTRPDEDIRTLEGFMSLRVMPFDLEKAVELIKLLRYDEKVKKKFIFELKKGLFDKRSDFLSNPLLLTIMLITYKESAEIPEKISIFYEHAFDALFYKHDANKEIYLRDHYCELDVVEFKKLLSGFSVASYLNDDISFSNSKFLKHIDTGKKITGLNVKSEKFKLDLLKTVCVIAQDGLQYVYTHRSFQEYFTAYYLTFVDPLKRAGLLKRLADKGSTENVLSIYFELDQSGIEKDLLIPTLEKFFINVNSMDSELDKLAYITKIFGWTTVNICKIKGKPEPIVYIDNRDVRQRKHKSGDRSMGSVIYFLIDSYSKIYPKYSFKAAYCMSNKKRNNTIRKYKDSHFTTNSHQDLDFHRFYKSHNIDFESSETIQVFDELGLLDYLRKTLKSISSYYKLIKDRQNKCTKNIEELLLS
jgi:hypothetical protein